MDSVAVEATKRGVLARGSDDWVYAGEVVLVAAEAVLGSQRLAGYPDDPAVDTAQLATQRKLWLAEQERSVFPLAVRAVKELIRDGLVWIGDVADGGFQPWQGLREELEARIDAAGESAVFPLLPGDLFWLKNTAAGNELAEQIEEY